MSARGQSGIENRKTPRADVRIAAELAVEGATMTATTKNVSLGGVCVETQKPLTKGAAVRLKMFIVEDDIESDSRPLEAQGTIQWISSTRAGHAAGVKFAPLDPTTAAALASALRSIPNI